jgi:hypothetical protein
MENQCKLLPKGDYFLNNQTRTEHCKTDGDWDPVGERLPVGFTARGKDVQEIKCSADNAVKTSLELFHQIERMAFRHPYLRDHDEDDHSTYTFPHTLAGSDQRYKQCKIYSE